MIIPEKLQSNINNYLIDELKCIAWGVVKAERLEPEAKRLEKWLAQGNQGKMTYLEKNFDLRIDPTILVPGARSVLMLIFNYYPKVVQSNEINYKIAKYAYGKDYHKVIKTKLKKFHFWLMDQLQIRELNARFFVDSAPILERDLAKRAGLGWIGKNTLLLQKKTGSFFFIAEYISDLEFSQYGNPAPEHCGSCQKCIDACPTDAISESGYVLDSSRCISYLNIEYKKDIPDAYKHQLHEWVFGCDICQDVCPWNRFAEPLTDLSFHHNSERVLLSNSEWESLQEQDFEQIFSSSAFRRAGYKKLSNTIKHIKKEINKK